MRIYIHPTCSSSYKLVKYMMERDISVELIDASVPASIIERGIVSVPWVEIGGEPVAADPVEPEEIEQMLKGNYSPRIDPMEAFRRSLLASSYLSALSLAHARVDVGITTGFLKAALRSAYSGLSAIDLMREVKRDSNSIYEALEEKIAKVVAASFLRELYWTRGAREELRTAFDERLLSLWLLSKISIGRAGIPGAPPKINRNGISIVMSLLESSGERMMHKIVEEQETIIKDLGYLEHLNKVSRR